MASKKMGVVIEGGGVLGPWRQKKEHHVSSANDVPSDNRRGLSRVANLPGNGLEQAEQEATRVFLETPSVTAHDLEQSFGGINDLGATGTEKIPLVSASAGGECRPPWEEAVAVNPVVRVTWRLGGASDGSSIKDCWGPWSGLYPEGLVCCTRLYGNSCPTVNGPEGHFPQPGR